MRRKNENQGRTSALVATLVGLVFMSCSPSSPTDPGQTEGQIQVNVSTSGTGIPSSFAVTLNGGSSRSVPPDGSVTYGSLNPGNYTVELGVPGNCTISGAADRSVGVQESSTSTIAYSVSCSAVPTGAIGVTTSTTGSPADPDGYTVSVDGGSALAIGVDDNLLIPDLGLGEHELELSGVAANCLVQGANPRTVSVSENQTTPTEFEVVCSATTGRIDVTVTTTGQALDADGYDVELDDGAVTRAVDTSGSVDFTGVEQGEHTLSLGDVASNCTVTGDNPVSVDVVAGETADVSFAVECEATTGGLQVSASTTGDQPDTNGYAVSVDGSLAQTIGVNGSTTFADLPPGNHEVELTGVASNCAVGGENPRSVEVVAGATASTNFDVACASTVGSIEVSVTTTGDAIDADGYSVVLDGGVSTVLVDANDTAVFGGLAPGEHTLALGNVAANCMITSGNPATADVTAGAQADVAFTVVCEELTGDIQVNMSTTGDEPDPNGYTVSLDGGSGLSVSNNGSRTFPDVVIGEHEIEIGDVASNCAVQGSNPRTVNVNENQTTQVNIDVECSATAGQIEVTVTTTGEDLDDSYFVVVDGGASTQLVDANDTALFGGIAPGQHDVELQGVAGNCTVSGDNPETVSVTAGQTADASFAVACTRTTGDIRVTTSTSGSPQDPTGYEVTVSGVGTQSIANTDEVLFEDLQPGGYTVELSGLAVNCSASGGLVRNPTVTADDEVLVAYTISCVPLVGDLRVNVSTTGDDQDQDGYEARLDGNPGSDRPVGINGSTTFSGISTGSHSVTLVDVADNCEIVGSDSKSQTVVFGTTVDLDFDVTCEEQTGSVQVNMMTGGDDPDTEYTATLSAGQGSQTVPANGSTTFTDVPTGNYTVTISNIAPNCTDDGGDNQEPVTVTTNATADATFSYTCTSTTGSIAVDVSTSGVDQDSDGYTITLDGGTPRAVGIDGSTTYNDLAPGDYDVGIDVSTVADNCTVNEANPQTEGVTAASTSNVSFTVTCEEITGSIFAEVSTSGVDQDTDGYTFTLNGGTPRAVGIDGSTTYSNLTPGDYDVGMDVSTVADNCSVNEANPQTESVTAASTSTVSFTVTCEEITGSITVTTSTTGTPDPNGYLVALDGGPTEFIDDATPVTFADLSPASYDVLLSGLDGTCAVVAPSSNPATQPVLAGETEAVDFTVDCT